MNVFVESNFVLELALEQQEVPLCNRLVDLARAKLIRLLLPAYSFIEPHETLIRRQINRSDLQQRVSKELTQLARSKPLAERAAASQEIMTLLAESDEYETRRIEQVKHSLWLVGDVLPLDLGVLRRAAGHRADYGLSPQDAIVYASIRARLDIDHVSGSCFVSRNPGDFDNADLRQDLASFNCKYFSSFGTALQYIEHVIQT